MFGKEYWLVTDPLSWSIIAYFTKLIERDSTLNKRSASYYILQDLEKLYIASIDIDNLKRHISNLRRILKNPTKDDREILNKFWEEHSQELKKKSL